MSGFKYLLATVPVMGSKFIINKYKYKMCNQMFIIRYSEIGLKGEKSRRQMENILIQNIKSELERYNIFPEFKKSDGRIYIFTDSKLLYDILPRIFGIKSFSHAEEFKFRTIEEIVSITVSKFSGMISGKKFAVSAKRSGSHSFTSMDIEKILGDALYKYSAGVDLEHPDIRIYIEIRDNRFYLFTEKIEGPGGLPLKSEGKLLSLFSGGIDSPVATYMVMKRGSATDLLFCSLAHPVDTVQMLMAAKNLLDKYSIGYNAKIFIIDGSKLVTAISEHPDQMYTNIIFKKLLYEYAEYLCEKYGYNGMVTGESIGQVSSQTPQNLMLISEGIKYPVYRPLIGFDKEETINYSKSKSLFMNQSSAEFCSLFSKNPGIIVNHKDFYNEIKKFNVKDYMQELVEIDKNTIDDYIKSIKNKRFRGELDNVEFIDLRSRSDYENWHEPGAINLNLGELRNFIEHADRFKNYVFYCKKGLNSAYAASIMSKHGFNAYYVSERDLKSMQKN